MSLVSAARSLVSGLGDRHVQYMMMLPITLPFAARKFLRERPPLDSLGSRLQHALETREQRFLEIVRTRVFAVPDSPYKKLLDHARYELGDIERSLQTVGLEETLKELARAGVYLTPGEYKGRQDVVRGAL